MNANLSRATLEFGTPGYEDEPPLRILLSAFACAPGLGSEEGVGWGLAWALAQKHFVHVLTTRRHRRLIENYLVDFPCARLTFSYLDFPESMVRCVITSSLWQIYYHAWQLRVGAWSQSVANYFVPDIVHHVTYGRYWTPTTLWKEGAPFVWGPLGGGDQCPRIFFSCLTWRERASAGLRSLAQFIARRDPQLRHTARACQVALASTTATANRLRGLGCSRVETMLQMAIDEKVIADCPGVPRNPFTFCTVGRLLGWKGQQLAVRAFAEAALPDSRLLIIGEGPNKVRLRNLAVSLGVATSVSFTGNISREKTIAAMRSSVALLHPSLHDQAPTAVFEAMAVGTPVIALALGGLVHQISSADGFLIRATNPEKVVDEMAQSMRRLLENPPLRQRMGQAAIDRVRTRFTWKRRAEDLAALYHSLLGRRTKSLSVKSESSCLPAYPPSYAPAVSRRKL